MEDRRKIEGIEGALRKVLKRTKTTPTKLANKHGIDRKYIFSAYRSALISGKALDVLDMCGYRLAFVPKGAKMPEGTVLLPDREPIVAEKMPKKPKIEHIAETDHDGDTENTPVSDSQAISDGVSTGYVSYIVHN